MKKFTEILYKYLSIGALVRDDMYDDFTFWCMDITQVEVTPACEAVAFGRNFERLYASQIFTDAMNDASVNVTAESELYTHLESLVKGGY